MSNDLFLYPNVSSIPGQGSQVGSEDRARPRKPGELSDFDLALDRSLDPSKGRSSEELSALAGLRGREVDLSGPIKEPIKFSSHAAQRLQERKIKLDPSTLAKVSDAIDRAEAKGVEESLVLTDQAALIVSVKNRTVITAMDKHSLNGNVFTNIDGAVIV